MSCEQCVFFSRLQNDRVSPPCISCTSDKSDKGYCVAARSGQGFVPVISKITEEARAREIVQRGINNGSALQLLLWSKEKRIYQFI